MPGIQKHLDGPIGWIIIDNPERRNAFAHDMWRALADTLTALADDPAIRVAIIRGAGTEAFASGADISQLEHSLSTAERSRGPEAGLDAFLRFPKPLIAMIHGYCIGGGLAVAMKADLLIASQDASFAIPAARLGVAYPPDALRDLVSLVGPAEAKTLLFTARRINADDAKRIGLVNDVIAKDALESTVVALAKTIAANAPLSMLASKACIDEAAKCVMDEPRLQALVDACTNSADFREGRLAFAEKRAPIFTGR